MTSVLTAAMVAGVVLFILIAGWVAYSTREYVRDRRAVNQWEPVESELTPEERMKAREGDR